MSKEKAITKKSKEKARFSWKIFSKHKKVTRADRALSRETTWFYLMVIALCVNVLSLVGNFYLFIRLSADEALVTPNITEEQITTINRGGLEETVRFFDEREDRYQSLRATAPGATDPSIVSFGNEESAQE